MLFYINEAWMFVDEHSCGLEAAHKQRERSLNTVVYLSFGPIGQKTTASVTQARARRLGAAASVSRRRRERRSHTLAASQTF
jgi:threonine dehydrogenase-like Zn-dependent dehydrogenase